MSSQIIGKIQEIVTNQGKVWISIDYGNDVKPLLRAGDLVRDKVRQIPHNLLLKKEVVAYVDKTSRGRTIIKHMEVVCKNKNVDIKNYISYLETKQKKSVKKISLDTTYNQHLLDRQQKNPATYVDKKQKLRYSNHALRRARQRNIYLNEDQQNKLIKALDAAKKDEIKKALFFIERKFLFAVNCKSKIIITAMRYENSLSVRSIEKIYFLD